MTSVGRTRRAACAAATTAVIAGALVAADQTSAGAAVAGDSAAIVVSSGTLGGVGVSSSPAGVSMQPGSFATGTQDYALRGCAGRSVTFGLSGSALQVGSQNGSSVSVASTLVAGQALVLSTPSSRYWFRCLPDDFPPITVATHGPTSPGWYVTAIVSNGNASPPAGLYAMILNSQGTPVWYMPSTGFPAIDFQLFTGTSLSWTHFGSQVFSVYQYDTQAASTIATVPTPHWSAPPTVDVHELLRLSNGDYMFLAYPTTTDSSASFTDATGATHTNANIEDCVIEEVTPSGHLVWSWDAYYDGHVSPSETFLGGTASNNVYDVYHCNSLAVDPTASNPSQANVLVSMRNTDAIYLIQRSAGTVLWKLANDHATGSALTAAQATGSEHEPVLATTYLTGENTFGGQHDARFQNGSAAISFYDDHSGQPTTVNGARAVQFNVDTTGNTATETSEYPAPDSSAAANATGNYRPDPAADGGAGDNIVDWGFRNALGMTEFNNAGTDMRDIYFNTSASSTTSSGSNWSTYRFVKLPPGAFSANLLRQSAGLPRTSLAPTAPGWDPPGEVTTPLTSNLAGTITGTGTTAASPGNNWVDVFWRGADGALWDTSTVDGGATYTTPSSLHTGQLAGTPNAVSSEPGRVDVLWRGPDNNLQDDRFADGVGWSGPQAVGSGATMAGDPFAVAIGFGRLDVFWKGTDGNLWHVTSSDSAGWGTPQSLRAGPLGSDPHPVSPGSGRVFVFWTGSAGDLQDMTYADGSGWSGAQSLGGAPLASDPRAVSASPGTVDVFWRGSDDALWHDAYTGSSGWAGAQSVGAGGQVTSAPVPVSPVSNAIDVFWRTTDGLSGSRWLGEATYSSGSGWSFPAAPSTTSLNTDPSAIRTASGSVALFAQSLDSALWFQKTTVATAAHSWSVATTPAQSSSAKLYGVGCVNATGCWAVGNSGGAPLIEQYNGSAWAVVAGAPATGSLNAVTCASATDCWAVGGNAGAKPPQPLIEQYDGSAWTAVGGPGIATSSSLAGVACTGASDCWAVGSQSSGSQTLIEHFDGTAWSTVPAPASGASNLFGVSCTAPGACEAVGSAGSSPLIEALSGSTWTVSNAVTRGASATLKAVACFTATSCWAGGWNNESAGVSQTLAEHLDQHGWAAGSTPDAGNTSSYNVFNGMTCAAYSDCWAVGRFSNGSSGAYSQLIERNAGSGWTVAVSPNVGAVAALSSVACASTTNCWAVGYTTGGSVTQALIEYFS